MTRASFCPIDSLILSMVVYAPFERVPFPEPLPFRRAAAQLRRQPDWDRTGVVMARRIPELVVRAAASRRFGALPLVSFVSLLDEGAGIQFAAATWSLPDGTLYLAFRGTDDTLVGWQEAFRLAGPAPIPAQKQAEAYLAQVAARHPGKLRLGGHSKGGNLALWAALHAHPAVRRRILSVDSFDGPGFSRDLTGTPAYRVLSPRIHHYLPQGSPVGTLLCQAGRGQIIRSWGRGIVGQHDPFTWAVVGTHFQQRARQSPVGRRQAAVLRRWLASLPPEERTAFVEALFHLLRAGQAHTLTDWQVDRLPQTLAGLEGFRQLDPTAQATLRTGLHQLLRSLGPLRLSSIPKESYAHEPHRNLRQ